MVRRLLNRSRRCKFAHVPNCRCQRFTAIQNVEPGSGEVYATLHQLLKGCAHHGRVFRRAFAQPQHRFAPSQPIPKGNRLTISVSGRIIWMFGFCSVAIRRNSCTARCCSTWYCFFKRLSPFSWRKKLTLGIMAGGPESRLSTIYQAISLRSVVPLVVRKRRCGKRRTRCERVVRD
jgi:hypothetical protein